MDRHLTELPPPLSDYVDLVWLSEGYTQPHKRERVLPTGTMDLVIDLTGSLLDGPTVAGPRDASFLLDTSSALTMIGVRFKPGGGFPFFGLPAAELRNLAVPLDLLCGAPGRELSEQIREARTTEGRFRLLLRFLLQRLNGHGGGPNPAVRYAVRELQKADGARPVGDVAEDIGCSRRRLIELFRNEVGLPPKTFQRIWRFQHVLAALETGHGVHWAEIALACGYFDQAHLIHDFRSFCDLTPSDYLRCRTSRNHLAVTE